MNQINRELIKAAGKTIRAISSTEINHYPDTIVISFTDGTRLDIITSEWISEAQWIEKKEE